MILNDATIHDAVRGIARAEGATSPFVYFCVSDPNPEPYNKFVAHLLAAITKVPGGMGDFDTLADASEYA